MVTAPTPAFWRRFPDLNLVVAHGGGYIPYQYGRSGCRFRTNQKLRGNADDQWEPFEDSLHRLWFDTAQYDQASLELLLKVCGADRCLFGTERVNRPAPSGTPPVGDEVRGFIEGIEWLTADDRRAIFESNAATVFPRLSVRS